MAWKRITVTDYKDSILQIKDFATKTMFAGAVTPGTNTGTGILYGASATEDSVAETWTVTCTTIGGDAEAVFSVVGSVSGTLANAATSAAPYYSEGICFIILAGSVDFALGDSFTFAVASGTAEWEVMAYDNTSADHSLILKGIGSGTDEICIGFRSQTNSSTYYNIEVAAFSGYVSTNTFTSQPGYKAWWMCGSNSSYEMLIRLTSRHIYICNIIGTVYESGYAGWMLPNASPSQWTYPMFVGGSGYHNAITLAEGYPHHRCFWSEYDGTNYNNGSVMASNGWLNRSVILGQGQYPNLDGTRNIYPCGLTTSVVYYLSETGGDVYGHWEGLYAVSNKDVAVLAESVCNNADKGLLAVQNVSRWGADDIILIDLMGD